ncbi:hypothetical protein BU23DRAFT_648427 [Bimuria novae-zelandiae CBS 107.79]|uniref:Uncharacterized protein n=1 Tax=Bimuria novae-zelandiae CBS 107.79 TaxID=1447943 RepID=A0A6A5V2W7_9PLEO|nr:hypothetical protein BU23DRAFT_648427 [Bimuria novae-zelandiae CBS 107.79]
MAFRINNRNKEPHHEASENAYGQSEQRSAWMTTPGSQGPQQGTKIMHQDHGVSSSRLRPGVWEEVMTRWGNQAPFVSSANSIWGAHLHRSSRQAHEQFGIIIIARPHLLYYLSYAANQYRVLKLFPVRHADATSLACMKESAGRKVHAAPTGCIAASMSRPVS